MTVYSRDLTEVSSGQTDFGFRDQKGRAVGYRWFVYRAVFTPIEGGSGYTDPTKWQKPMPLEHLAISAFPTRNGKHYGASGGYLHCLTMNEAEALIAKRVEQARKRDQKKFA